MIYQLLWDNVLSQRDLCPDLGNYLSPCDLMDAFPRWAQNKERFLVVVYWIIIIKTGRGLKMLHLISSDVDIVYSYVFHSSVVDYMTNKFFLICTLNHQHRLWFWSVEAWPLPCCLFSGFSWDFSLLSSPHILLTLSTYAQPLNILKEHHFSSFYVFSSWKFFYFLRRAKVWV